MEDLPDADQLEDREGDGRIMSREIGWTVSLIRAGENA